MLHITKSFPWSYSLYQLCIAAYHFTLESNCWKLLAYSPEREEFKQSMADASASESLNRLQ